MRSKCHEESGSSLHLDLQTILHELHVSYPRRIGLVIQSNHLRPTYLICVHTHNHLLFLKHLSVAVTNRHG